jgi:hypothetical protein
MISLSVRNCPTAACAVAAQIDFWRISPLALLFYQLAYLALIYETKGTSFFFFLCGFDVCWLIKRKQNSFEELATRLGFCVGGE